jgi:hypothetical protein
MHRMNPPTIPISAPTAVAINCQKMPYSLRESKPAYVNSRVPRAVTMVVMDFCHLFIFALGISRVRITPHPH